MPNRSQSMTEQFKQQRIRKRKLYALLASLAVVVTTGTIWALVQPASAMTGEVICGMEEHTHTDECYENRLVCGLDEGEEHTHTEECWQEELICSKAEHVHEKECYAAVSAQTDSQSTATGQSEVAPDSIPNASSVVSSDVVSSQDADSSGSASLPESQSETVEGEESENALSQITDLSQMPKDIPDDYTEIYDALIEQGEGYVRVYAQPGTFPDGVELKAKLLDESSDEFAQSVQRLKDAGIGYDIVTALDISLYDQQGEKVEPIVPVYVSLDAGALLPSDANPETVQIQHHKEIQPPIPAEDDLHEAVYMNETPEVVLESVVDDTKGKLVHGTEDSSCIATFPVSSFSFYTITSDGWPGLKIKIQCVDEYGNELIPEHKPDDVHWNGDYKPAAGFEVIFMSGEHPKIDGYKYDNKAYFMRNGQYENIIYGIRRENNQWYYFPNDSKGTKILFEKQPDFTVHDGKEDAPDFIRLIYRKVTDINVQYMDDAGSFAHQEIPLSTADAPHGKNPDVIEYIGTELDISNVDVMPKSQTYFYVGRAYVGQPERTNEVMKVIRENGLPYGVTEDGKKLLVSADSPLKLMYHKTQTDIPDKQKTVSTREKGLTINLFDYNTDNPDHNVNKGHQLQFVPSPTGSGAKEYNRWTGKDGGIYTNIVDDKLGPDGYPVVDGDSLAYLFDPAKCRAALDTGEVDHVHTDLDHLFWQDGDGYYRYDSMTNFATIMAEKGDIDGHNPHHTDGGDFIVYSQPALAGGQGAKFMPFNKYSEANTPKPNGNGQDPVKREFHFGMTMEADFIMPPGGVIPDADGDYTGLRDMIFEFNGDDDVWVFIDGKLALDLGGIHGRYGGSINFRTGEVTTNAPPTPHSGWHQDNLYGITQDPNTLSSDELKKAREDAGFGKFSKHHFKFFYLERGKEASNCEIRFNLIPVEHGLVVGKRIPESMNGAATEHMWYQFQVEAEHNGNRHFLQNATYRRIRWRPGVDPITGGQSIGVGQTDEQGRFWLRAGERADFSGAIDLKHAGIQEHDKIKIYVREIFPDGTVVPKTTAWSGESETNGTYMEVTDATGKTRKIVPALYDSDQSQFHTPKTSTELQRKYTQATGEVAYEAVLTTGRDNEFNWIDFENDLGALSGLNITKHARHTDGVTPIPDVPFAIKVELWDTKANGWMPLPVGSDYWILNPDEKPEPDSKRQLEESAEGLIYITNSQTIHLHVLPGTKYRVSEVLTLEESAVYDTTYTDKTGVAGEELEPILNETGKQIGIGNKIGIAAGNQHYIDITNTGDPILMPEGSFVLTKQVSGMVLPNNRFHFHLSILDDTADYQCTATHYGYPPEAHVEDPKIGYTEPLAFTQAAANLELYPGEIVVITGLPEGKSLKVQEVFAEEEKGYYDVSFQEEGKDPIVGTEIGGENSRLTPTGSDHVVKVNCMNRSNLKEHSELQLKKTIKRTDLPNGAPTEEDLQKDFNFKVTLQKPNAFTADQVRASIKKTNGIVISVPLEFIAKGDDYVAEINLKHGEVLTITKLPVNVNVVIQETGHKEYAVAMNGKPGDQITVNLKPNSGQMYTVECVNSTGVEMPETGGHGRMPYYLLGAGLMMCAAVWMYHRRRREGRNH